MTTFESRETLDKNVKEKIFDEKFMNDWNRKFPHDQSFREKNNVTFNSPEHRASCPIDIYFKS